MERFNDNRLTDNVSEKVKKPVSLAKQGATDNIKIGFCEFCGAEFERRVSWKRFCCDDCRIKAWETKNGKRLSLGKVGG